MDNEKDFKLISLIKEFFKYLSLHRKRQLLIILVVILISAFSEFLAVGAVLPFLEVVSNPSEYWQNQNIQFFIRIFNIESPDKMIIPATFIFSLAVIFSALMRLSNIWLQYYVTAKIASEMSCEAYKNSLYQDYEYYLKLNSSKTIAASTSQSLALYTLVGNILNLIGFLFISITLYLTLFFISLQTALLSSFIFIFAYVFLAKYLQPKISFNGKLIANLTQKQIKLIQEGLGSIRDILLDSNQEFYSNIYRDTDLTMRMRLAQNSFFSTFPRYTFEALGIILIAVLAYVSTNNSGVSNQSIVILGAFALGAQRLLPALQQIYGSWALIKSSSSSAAKILELITLKVPNKNILMSKPYEFKKSILIRNLSFSYDVKSKSVLENINLEIFKGEKIGFVGETGCGKSTLIDIIIGLLEPIKGEILIDGINLHENKKSKENFIYEWRKSIAYVPQTIFLSDTTFKNNIAFGVEEKNIDFDLMKKAAEISQLSGFIDSKPYSYESYVGERGIRLSGGQRQRIGIARAIYKGSKILVLDEATSALDMDTEKLIIDELNSFDKDITIIMIAHRLSSLNGCDRIYEISSNSNKLKEF